MSLLLEIAVFNLPSALIAEQNGADRIELCRNIKEGGISPPEEWIIRAKQSLHIAMNIMIRPRPGNFVYSGEEFEQMKKEILFGKEQHVNGFVFGMLNTEHKIDLLRNKELVDLAAPLPCTFHRAFDEQENQSEALEILIRCGFKRVLTSGGKGNATDHLPELTRLVSIAANRILIMPGGGVRSHNAKQILQTGATEFHSAAIMENPEAADGKEIKRLKASLQK